MAQRKYYQPTCLDCGLFVSYNSKEEKYYCKKCGVKGFYDVELYEDDNYASY